MKTQQTELAPSVKSLVEGFRGELLKILGRKLIGFYLLGSIAFSGFVAGGDIDFFVVTKRPLTVREKEELVRMHGRLAHRYRYGNLFDGFYISVARARSPRAPRALGGGRDDAWPLHRAHLRHGAYIRLYGRPAERVFGPVSRSEIRRALRAERVFVERLLPKYPYWCVLQLCRLLYSHETKEVVVSKLGAAEWALGCLPQARCPLIRAAVRVYRGRGARSDYRILSKGVQGFFEFASKRTEEVGY